MSAAEQLRDAAPATAGGFSATVERNALLRALGHVQAIVKTRETIPVLANVLIEALDGQTLRITGTDLDLQIRETAPAIAASGSGTTVGAHKLHEIVRELPDGCQIEMVLADGRLKLASGRARFTLPTLPAGDFPILPEEEHVTRFDCPAALLRRLIDQARFAVSANDVARPYLAGIFLSDHRGQLRAAATDGFRGATVTAPLPEGAEGLAGVILPARLVDELRKLIDDRNEPVAVALSDKRATFDLGTAIVTGKLIEGSFPDIDRVMPIANGRALSVPPRGLEAAVRRVALLAEGKKRTVRFNVEPDRLQLDVQSVEHGAADEEVPAIWSGAPIQLGLNGQFVLDNLQRVSGDTVELHLGENPQAPVLITAPAEPDCAFVLMPMRV